MTLASLLSIVVMILGFGFVIFWHELGHFIGARRAGIRVEQFAVGMGHALVSYRKGMGIRFGSNQAEFERLTQKEFDAREMREKERRDAIGEPYALRFGEPSLPERYDIARDLGLGETEYRLSMLPIGGYVKPTGQDDLRPSHVAAADDPKCYAAAPVGKRMVLISAGVIMNVILAAILFFVLFLYGFKVQAPIIGAIQSGSPAAAIGLKPGDQVVSLNGHAISDFTKILMNVGLLPPGVDVPIVIRRDGQEQTLQIHPRATTDNGRMLAMGFGPSFQLKGYDPSSPEAKLLTDDLTKMKEPTPLVLKPGERVTAINGTPITSDDTGKYDDIVQQTTGEPIDVTIENADKVVRHVSFVPGFSAMFDRRAMAFAGLMPRTQIDDVPEDPTKSSAAGILRAGDIVLNIAMPAGPTTQPVVLPSSDTFRKTTIIAGAAEKPLVFTVLRDGATLTLPAITPKTKIEPHVYGLGVPLNLDVTHPVISETVADSAAQKAGVPAGATVTQINGKPVQNWSQIHHAIAAIAKPGSITVSVTTLSGEAQTFTYDLSAQEIALAQETRYVSPLEGLSEQTLIRKTTNPLQAFAWGVGETRDLILQGYVTIQRVFGGSVPASNMSGPIGIFRAGTNFAQRGPDWFLWFLAVVSANLAVVNFLPVPILDGWHFLSLVKEKITGRPVSERVQEVAQYVGLAMILSLLIFVSYNDIARW